MEDLLVRLVEAPTLLGDEAPGQAVMREAFAGPGPRAGGRAARPGGAARAPGRLAVQLGRGGQGQRGRGLGAGRAGGRTLAGAQRAHRRGEPGAGGDVVLPAVRCPPRRRLALRPRRGRHEGRPGGDRRRRRGACGRSASRRTPGWSCSRWSRRSAAATGLSPACWPATAPTPRSSPSPPAARSSTRRWACSGSPCGSRAGPPTPATRPRARTPSRPASRSCARCASSRTS